MGIKFYFILIVSFCTCTGLQAQESEHLKSPDGHIVYNFFIESGKPFYEVSYYGVKIIEHSALQINFNHVGSHSKLKQSSPAVFSAITENYQLVVGKAKNVTIQCNQAAIYLNETFSNRSLQLVVRAFNDGVAFRYVFPKEADGDSLFVWSEGTQFNLSGNPIAKVLELPNFTSSHEGIYTTAPFRKIDSGKLFDMPALFEYPDKAFVAITEAALLDYAGMYLTKRDSILTGVLSPLPANPNIAVRASLPHQSPWRVMLINKRIGALIESNIITSLAPPLAVKDIAWIKTGLATFPWWNGTVIPDSGIVGGNNFETNKYYIDFCSENHIMYHTVVEYGGHEWYTNNGGGYQPGELADVTKPVKGLDMQQICDYAKSKNVGIRVWVHWKALYPKLDTAFALFEKWGIKGMMVDFMDRDDQEMVNIQTEIIKKAAQHHLHIQFHGAYKPTGLSRTYPNEFTREGTLNYEHFKWDSLVTPDADLDVVFTRMLAGPTDYHLGGFRSATRQQFEVRDRLPMVMGTRCHMLGMYVVLENFQGMLCDYPGAYINQPGFEVLQHIPTTWDETHVLAAKPNEYVSIARKNNAAWYIGTINNRFGREITLDFNFLPKGKYEAQIYKDDITKPEVPNTLVVEYLELSSQSVLKLNLAADGGSVIIIKKRL